MPQATTYVQLHADMSKLMAFLVTMKRHNNPEWMAYAAERINAALEALGTDDRVEWPGKWAHEFRLVSGG